MPSTVFTTVAALVAAAPKAQPGSTLILAKGTYKEALILKNAKFASPGITIDGAGASIGGLEVDLCAGITFTGFEITVSQRTQVVANVTNSQGVAFIGGKMHDPVNKNRRGLMFRDSKKCSADGVEFENLGTGVLIVASPDTSVANSLFHDINGADGVQSNKSGFVSITGNRFTDFFPTPGAHPDAIQFITTGQTAPVTDIIVAGNIVVRGKGGIIQGVFMSDEAKVGYQNVTITGNALVGCMFNGIATNNATAQNIADNLVQPYTDMNSWVQINGGSGVAASNAAPQVVAPKAVSVTGTTTVKAVPIGDLAPLDAWLRAHNMPPWGSVPAPAPPPPTPAPPPPPPPTPAPPPPPTEDPQIALLRAEVARVAAQAMALQSEIDRLNAQNASLNAQLLTANGQVADAQAVITLRDGHIGSLRAAIGSAQTTLANAMGS